MAYIEALWVYRIDSDYAPHVTLNTLYEYRIFPTLGLKPSIGSSSRSVLAVL